MEYYIDLVLCNICVEQYIGRGWKSEREIYVTQDIVAPSLSGGRNSPPPPFFPTLPAAAGLVEQRCSPLCYLW